MNITGNETEDFRVRVRKTAHDVRTPLTSIAGFAQLLIEDEALSAGARGNAETILEESENLSEMLEKFFDEVTAMLNSEATTIDEL